MRVIANFLERSHGADEATASVDACPSTAVTRIYQANADFVWRSLQRLGIRDPDLDDVLQEVFVVVHQRLHTFDGSAKMTTWLFAICLRVASASRAAGLRAHRE